MPAATAEESIVDAGVYLNGRRVERPASLTDAYQRLVAEPGTMAWIGLYRPAEEQLQTVAEQFGLHKLAVEDAIVAHQRPKLERYGHTLFVVLRAARYHDDVEEVHFGELHLFVGPSFVLTVRHDETPGLAAVRHRMEGDPELLAQGPEAILYGVLDAVVDGYAPVVAGLQHDIDEIVASVMFRSHPVHADVGMSTVPLPCPVHHRARVMLSATVSGRGVGPARADVAPAGGHTGRSARSLRRVTR